MKRVWRAIQASSIEVFLALLCFVSGLPILINPMTFAPAAIAALFPLPIVILWGIALTVGGALNLVGLATENVYLRRSGLMMLSVGALIMGGSVLVISGWTRGFVIGTYLVFSWATATRYHALGKVISARRKRWKNKVAEQKGE